jgi:AraC-like DNA-binding protein
MILIIMEELRLKSKFYKESVKGLLQSLMVSLARLFESDVNSIESDENLDVISVAMEYVAKHFQEKITISTLAELCHLSETHFRRIFSQTMNISPQAYINRIRIEAVCKLLHTTNKPISEIAIKCGFITPSTLNRNFKEITGMTPVLFRRDHHYYHNKLKDSKILSYEGWR